jgi:cytochrome b6-f complex iron-sulfur subunit
MSEPTSDRVPLPVIEEDGMGRRAFINTLVGAVGCGYVGLVSYPVYRYLASPVEKAASVSAINEVTLPKADELPTGSALIFKFGTKPAMLIHHEDNTWSALSAVCTHLACTVQYEPDKQRIFCACHGGTYDPKTGTNTGGPPPKPLEKFRLNVTAGSVTVSRG